LIGFPYDHGALKAGSRAGSQYGPDSFRRFLKMGNLGSLENPEYDFNIADLVKICDYGNIVIEGNDKEIIPLYDKLQAKVCTCIKRGNIPFVIGGSRDLL